MSNERENISICISSDFFALLEYFNENKLFEIIKMSKNVLKPDILYGELYEEIQSKEIFSNPKTFVDCTACPSVTESRFFTLFSQYFDEMK